MDDNRINHSAGSESKEPFFGFIEWLTVCALVSGAVVTLLLRLDGVVRIVSLGIYGVLLTLSGIWLFRSGRF